MACGDVLSLEDLQTAKKHQIFEAEVITGKVGGVAGVDIDYATNAATGQTQKTLPAILRDLGFEPASFDFTTGGTLGVNDRNKAVLWPMAGGGDGDWYNWEGVLPKVVPAASTPYTTGGVTNGAWRPVGDITLRGDLSSTADDYGDALLAVKQPYPGAAPRTQHGVNQDFVHIRTWAGDAAIADWTPHFNAAAQAVKAAGGGTIHLPAGVLYGQLPLVSGVYWQGAGRGVTVISQPAGANRDIVVSENFSSLTGVGPLNSAPKNFGVCDLTIDGNYLADYKAAALNGSTTYNNTSGYGLKIFGSKFNIDVELVNCPKVGAYFETFDYTGYGDEADSFINLSGRVFGKEAVIFRGPADINIDHIIIGCAGWLATTAERNSTLVMSDVYPGEPVHVMVSDEQAHGGSMYNGHHEFTMMHLYGNYSGLGYKTMNTGRLKGSHMVCENCRGGAYFGSRVWGEISILECHNNGRNPAALAGTLPMLPDIENASIQGFTLNATVRRVTTQAADYLALKATGRLSRVKLNYFSIAPVPVNSPVALIQSESSAYDILCVYSNGDAVTVEGTCNTVIVNGRSITGGSLVKRVGGVSSQNRGNDISIVARDCDNILNIDGLVTTESFKITGELLPGQTVFSGAALDMVNRGISLDVAVRVGTVFVSSEDFGRVNLDNSVTTEQTVVVNHNYFQAPDAAQVAFNLYDPSPSYGGAMQYIYLQTITSTQLTFVYKLSATGSGGPLALCWRIA